MPVLEIVGDSGQPVQFAPAIIVAAMLSPNDERRRHELEAAVYTETALHAREPTIPSKIAAITHRGPGLKSLLKATQLQRYDGFLAGQILLFVLRCAVHRPQDANVRKAIHVVEKELVRQAALQRRKFPASTAMVRNAWGNFKNVSHLWAAHHIFDPEKGNFEITAETLVEFLGTAEAFRRKAEEHYPPKKIAKAEPLLSPKETWRAPEKLALPDLDFDAPPLSKLELNRLDEYRSV